MTAADVRTDAPSAVAPATADAALAPPRTRAFTLRRRAHKAALLAHILTSVGWFGVASVVAFGAVGAGMTSDAGLSSALYRTIELLPWLSIPIGLLAIITGAVLSLGTTWGFFRHWWLVAKIAIAAAAVVTDALVIRHFAHQAVATGVGPRPLHDGSIAHVVVLAIATVLSVFKPRGRTPLGRRRLGPARPARPA